MTDAATAKHYPRINSALVLITTSFLQIEKKRERERERRKVAVIADHLPIIQYFWRLCFSARSEIAASLSRLVQYYHSEMKP